MRKWLFLLGFQLVTCLVGLGQSSILFVGTYTAKGSEGIYVYRFAHKTGALQLVSVAKDLKNPSFLALAPDRKHLYAVEENQAGRVSAFRVEEKTGQLTLLNSQLVNGDHPCHLTVDKTGKWVLVGNYSSGNLAVFPVQPDGSLGPASQVIQHEGKGANPQRQEKPHVHSINLGPNNQDVFVPDLGMDKIMAYQFNPQNGSLVAGNPPFVATDPGSGPRHFAFHPTRNFAYAILELTSSVAVFRYQGDGKLVPLQTIKTLPDDFSGANSCADLHVSPDGKFLYGSNRGHNSIAVFEVDGHTGQIRPIQHQSTLGKTPRNFTIDPTGRYLLVANQDSDNIQVFRRNRKTGRLTPTPSTTKVSMPVCLKFQ
jgi:6-phosphogluconolactonase